MKRSSVLRSAFRIAVGVGLAVAVALGMTTYTGIHSFNSDNARSIALCNAVVQGAGMRDVLSLAETAGAKGVILENGNVAIKIPGERLCLVELKDGRAVHAHVAMPD